MLSLLSDSNSTKKGKLIIEKRGLLPARYKMINRYDEKTNEPILKTNVVLLGTNKNKSIIFVVFCG